MMTKERHYLWVDVVVIGIPLIIFRQRITKPPRAVDRVDPKTEGCLRGEFLSILGQAERHLDSQSLGIGTYFEHAWISRRNAQCDTSFFHPYGGNRHHIIIRFFLYIGVARFCLCNFGMNTQCFTPFPAGGVYRQIEAQPQSAIPAGKIFKYASHLDESLPLGDLRTHVGLKRAG